MCHVREHFNVRTRQASGADYLRNNFFFFFNKTKVLSLQAEVWKIWYCLLIHSPHMYFRKKKSKGLSKVVEHISTAATTEEQREQKPEPLYKEVHRTKAEKAFLKMQEKRVMKSYISTLSHQDPFVTRRSYSRQRHMRDLKAFKVHH